MRIYPITNTLIDCFWGEGWENQARVKITPKKPVVVSASKPIPKNFFPSLKVALEARNEPPTGVR